MNGEQQPHDAQKTLADLRDHLARHDKPIAFFFGAGTSCAVPASSPGVNAHTQPLIPAVASLTAMSKKDASDLGEKFEKAWESIEVSGVSAHWTEWCARYNSDLRYFDGGAGLRGPPV